MAEGSEPTRASLDAFLDQFWKDQKAGEVRSLSEYLRLFPGDPPGVAAEYGRHQAQNPPTLLAVPPARNADGSEPPHTSVGPYRLLRRIGQGGQGTVYLARDSRLQRQVALKVLTAFAAASPETLERFRREAAVASRLDHPGICAVYDTGVEQGSPFIAMRYVEGTTLAEKIAEARRDEAADPSSVIDLQEIPTAGTDAGEHDQPSNATGPTTRAQVMRVVAIIEATARALHVAHESQVIHRDIKPGNIMVTPDGHPVILDFGMAREIEGDTPTLTRTGDFFGTPAYMSPEQIAGQRIPLDRRTDVYSLGVTLYECLTLRRPFDAPTRAALYQAIMAKDPPDPRRQNPAIPHDLKVVIETALEKDRDRRYQSALDFAEELRRVRCFEPITAKPAGPWLRSRRWVQRNPALAAALSVVFMALSSGLVISLFLLAEMRSLLAETRKAQDDRRTAVTTADVEHRRSEAFNYASTIRRAAASVQAGKTDEARRLLTECSAQLRGWEWRHLDVQCDPGLLMTMDNGGVSVEALAFSPGGAWLATGDANGVLRLWDPESGKSVKDLLPSQNAKIRMLAFSVDGSRLLSVAEDSSLRVWDMEKNRLSYTESPPSPEPAGTQEKLPAVVWAAFDQDAALLLVVERRGAEGSVRLVDLARGETLTSQDIPMVIAARHLDGDRWQIFRDGGDDISSSDVEIKPGPGSQSDSPLPADLIADVGSTIAGDIPGEDSSPTGPQAAEPRPVTILHSRDLGLELKAVIINPPRYEVEPQIGRGHDLKVSLPRLVFLHPASSWAATQVRLGDPITGLALGVAWSLAKNDGRARRPSPWRLEPGTTAFACDPTRNVAALGTSDGVILHHSTSEARVLRQHHAHASGTPVNALEFSRDGRWMVSGGSDGMIRMWQGATMVSTSWRTLGGGAKVTAPDPLGRRLLYKGSFTDLTTRTTVPWDSGDGRETSAAAFHPSGSVLAVGTGGGRIILRDSKSLDEVGSLDGDEGSVQDLVFSGDGTHVAACSEKNQSIKVWDWRRGAQTVNLALDEPSDWGQRRSPARWIFALDPDARNLAVAREWGSIIRTFELGANGVSLKHEVNDAMDVRCIAISADGRLLAGGSEDNHIRVWEASTGRLVQTLRGHEGGIRTVAFSRTEPCRLVSCSSDGTAKLWDPITAEDLLTLRGPAGDFLEGAEFGSDDDRLIVFSNNHLTVFPGAAPTAAQSEVAAAARRVQASAGALAESLLSRHVFKDDAFRAVDELQGLPADVRQEVVFRVRAAPDDVPPDNLYAQCWESVLSVSPALDWAENIVSALHRRVPRNPDYAGLAGITQVKLGRPGAGLDLLLQARKNRNGTSDVMELPFLAMALAATGRNGEAQDALDHAYAWILENADNDERLRWLLDRAEAEVGGKDAEAARTLVEDGFRENPRAGDVYRRIQESTDLPPGVRLAASRLAAIRHLEDMSELDQDAWSVVKQAGPPADVLKLAHAWAVIACNDDSWDRDKAVARGVALYRMGMMARAIEILEKIGLEEKPAEDLSDRQRRGLGFLAMARMKSGDSGKASSAAARFRQRAARPSLNPDLEERTFLAEIVAVVEGQARADALSTVLRLYDETPLREDVLAGLQARQDLTKEVMAAALVFADQVIAGDADFIRAAAEQEVQDASASAGLHARALNWAEAAFRLKPEDPKVLATLGVAEYRNARHDSAIRHLSTAFARLKPEVDPWTAIDCLAGLGLCWHALGDALKPREYLDRIESLRREIDAGAVQINLDGRLDSELRLIPGISREPGGTP